MRALLLLALASCGGFDEPCPASLGPSCVVATIHVTGSSNAAPIYVVVHANGSAERTIEPGSPNVPESPMSFAANDANVETFLSDLRSAGPIMGYSTTTIASGNAESGDLECLDANAPAAQVSLAHDCDVLTARQP